MNSNENFFQIFRKSGLRLTPQRVAISRVISESDAHPTALEVYEQVRREQPSISSATVYNVLDSLVDLGLVRVLGLMGDGSVHYDGNVTPHLHLNCINCHKIVDVDLPKLQKIERDIRQDTGFEVLGNRIVYYGLCPDCQNSHQIPIE
jgi:Fur family peroxide stress response transcriptional regulator